MSLDAMKQALEALLEHGSAYLGHDLAYKSAILSLRAAIEQAQEPVAWVCYGSASDEKHTIDYQQEDIDAIPVGTMLYTAPRQWQGLTDEERGQVINANFGTGLWQMAKDIEAKLRLKNS